MKLLKKRSTAALILIVLAVLSVFGVGGWKLGRERARAEDAFFTGAGGFSVYNDLMEAREVGWNLLHISEKAKGSVEAERRAAANAWAKLDEAKTPAEYAAAYQALGEALGELGGALENEDEDLRAAWEKQAASFAEYGSHLRFDDYYDEKAEAYNRLLGDPLARLIGGLTGSGEMPRFTE